MSFNQEQYKKDFDSLNCICPVCGTKETYVMKYEDAPQFYAGHCPKCNKNHHFTQDGKIRDEKDEQLEKKIFEAKGCMDFDEVTRLENDFIVCNNCEKKVHEGMLHYLFPNKKVCSSCFAKELKKAREQFIKDHPCPFKSQQKKQHWPANNNGQPIYGPDLEERCSVGLLLVCVGEAKCPIYNGGMK